MWPFKTSRCWIVPFPYWCRDERNETAPLQTLSPLTLFCPLFPHITVDFSCFPDAIVLGLHHERCNSGDVPKCKKCCQQLQKDKPDVKCDVHSSPALVAQDALKRTEAKRAAAFAKLSQVDEKLAGILGGLGEAMCITRGQAVEDPPIC